MRKVRLVVVAVLCVGCSGSDPASSAAPDSGTVSDSGTLDSGSDVGAQSNTPGKTVHTLDLEGSKREFIVYVPEKARGATPVPVVFMVHGTSGDGEKFYEISGWKEKADREGIITVYPSALTYCLYEDDNADGDFDDPGERKVTTKWASGQLGDPARMPLCSAETVAALPATDKALADHPLRDDMAFFKAMLGFLGEHYAVDAKRTYVTGFSNGAQMSARLGAEMADRFAATASHAGPMAVEAKAAARPITMVFSVGNVDDRFTPTGAPIPIAESTASIPVFSRMTADFLTTAQLANEYVYDQPKPGVARWTYQKSKVGAKNRFVAALVENCAHEYPNGKNHPMVMADALWEIFKNESLP